MHRFQRTDTFSWPLFMSWAAVLMIDQLLGFGSRGDLALQGAPFTVFSTGLAALILWCLLIGLRALVLRRKFAVRHGTIAFVTYFFSTSISTIAGMIAGLTLLPSSANAVTLAPLDAIVFSFAIFVVMNILAASVIDYKSKLSELLETEAELQMSQSMGSLALRDERKAIIDETRGAISRLIDDLDTTSAKTASEQLNQASERLIRPMSHLLMQDRSQFRLAKAPKVETQNWRETFRQIAGIPFTSPLGIAVFTTIYMGRLGTVETGNAQPPAADTVNVSADWISLIQFLLQICLAFGIFWIVSKCTQIILQRLFAVFKAIWARFALQAVALIAMAGATQTILIWVLMIPFVAGNVIPILLSPMVLLFPVTAVALSTAIYQTLTSRGNAALASLGIRREELIFSVARINEELWRQRRNLAKVLHGSLQAALVAGAIQMHQIVSSPKKFKLVLGQVQTKLLDIVHNLEYASDLGVDFEKELALMIETWSGICEISIEFEPGLKQRILLDRICQPAIIDLIGEASTNAVLHGRATTLKVELTSLGDRMLRVDAKDNGKPETFARPSGLGAELFNQVCTRWWIESSENGSVLSAELPLLEVDSQPASN